MQSTPGRVDSLANLTSGRVDPIPLFSPFWDNDPYPWNWEFYHLNAQNWDFFVLLAILSNHKIHCIYLILAVLLTYNQYYMKTVQC